jgi:YegS/Rv2252/BmrU family lipid kinase
LILNPAAGRGRAETSLGSGAVPGVLDIVRPPDPDAVRDEARRAVDAGDDRLLVGGGDGTLHHAIRGLAGSDCALGIVPLGSGNDLARALGVPLDPAAALRRALEAPVRRIDLGRIEGKPYGGVAGVGFDGECAGLARRGALLVRGRWVYPYAALRTLLTFRPPRLRIDTDAGCYEGRVMLAALANSPCYGGGMRVAPGAVLDDGRLDLVVVERVSRLRFLTLFPRVYRGTHVDLPEVRTLRVRTATLRADRDLTYYADGEPVAPCNGSRVEVWPAALAVAV